MTKRYAICLTAASNEVVGVHMKANDQPPVARKNASGYVIHEIGLNDDVRYGMIRLGNGTYVQRPNA